MLPNACATKMICTMNARSLLNFFTHRCCNRAQWEIRALAVEMLKEVKSRGAPYLREGRPPLPAGELPRGQDELRER